MDNKKMLIIKCPHCDDYIIITEINCSIFRHGILKENGIQIDPHSSKELCDYYKNNDLIYGCGKPFRLIKINENFYTEICEYI